MEITKREVIASVTIIALWLCLGFFLAGKIDTWQQDQNAEYDRAAKIEQQELFEHGMKTNLGNAFVYGKLEAKTPVSYPELEGDYSYIEKVKERYTMHTRVVTYTVNKQVHTRTETYWTWDVVDRESQSAEVLTFMDNQFDSGKIELPGEDYIETIKESSHVRYKYYGVPAKMTGTLYTTLENNSICDDSKFYVNKSVGETVDMLETDGGVKVFWILWIIALIIIVIVFYYMDNWWLNR